MKFTRNVYVGAFVYTGAISFVRSGCTVTAFRPENETHGWCLKVGGNVYTGFTSRRNAVESVGQFVL